MPVRLLDLIMIRAFGQPLLQSRGRASGEAQIMVLRRPLAGFPARGRRDPGTKPPQSRAAESCTVPCYGISMNFPD